MLFYLIPSLDIEKSAPILVGRIKEDQNRPSLTTNADPLAEMLETLRIRHPIYQKVANYIVQTGEMDPRQVAERILRIYATVK